jgi:hypothetical protein
MVPKGGFARLSLAPRAIRCGVPQGAHFVREWGRPSMALPLRTHIAGYPRERNSFGSRAAFAARSNLHS